MENITIARSGGLNCDTPGCGYTDASIAIEDYVKWVDAPCPKCGASLLTPEDYSSFLQLMESVRFINSIPGSLLGVPETAEGKEPNRVMLRFDFDGSGIPSVKRLQNETEE